jgi:hypothetical protein
LLAKEQFQQHLIAWNGCGGTASHSINHSRPFSVME